MTHKALWSPNKYIKTLPSADSYLKIFFVQRNLKYTNCRDIPTGISPSVLLKGRIVDLVIPNSRDAFAQD